MKANFLILGLILFGQGAAMVPNEVVNHVYYSSSSGLIELAAVCDVYRPEVQCWDADRTPNKEIAKLVTETFLREPKASGRKFVEIPFNFKKKNRVAVFRVPNHLALSQSCSWISGFTVEGNKDAPKVVTAQSDEPLTHYEFATLTEDPDKPTTSITVKLVGQLAPNVMLPVAEGAKKLTGSHTVSIGSISPGFHPSKPSNREIGHLAWDILVKISDDGNTLGPDARGGVFDESDMPYKDINRDGRPVRYGKPSKNHPIDFSEGSYALQGSGLGPYLPELGGRIWRCYVDPKYHPHVLIVLDTNSTVLFKDVPLDPIP